MTPERSEISRLIRRLFLQHQLHTMLSAPPLVYVMILVSGLDREQAAAVSKVVLPPLIPLLGAIIPYFVLHRSVHGAFQSTPQDPPETRLRRLLELPGIIEFTMVIMTLLGVFAFVGLSVMRFDKSPWTLPWAAANVTLLSLLMFILERRAFEAELRPYALAEFRGGVALPTGAGLLWPRQAWLLPYAFAIFVACTLVTTITILGRSGYDAYTYLLEQSRTADREQFAFLLRQTMRLLARNLVLPVSLVGGYLLLLAAFSAWRMARHQTQGMQSVRQALEGLAQGRPRMPDWVSTDEIGDLAAATTRVFTQLRSFSLSLKESALALQESAQNLDLSTSKQAETLSIQASALQETQVTTEEIKNTSVVAAQKAGVILQQAERADEISRTGESAIARGLTGLEEIGTQVRDMATRIRALEEQAQQIARITSMVKDLADQSNMLALNAAIEAVRSGESGKGFGVVAREIRALADQSIEATQNIYSILQELNRAIATAASMSDKGAQRVESSLQQVRDFGEQVHQLAAIARDNALSVRQITAAVNQQDAGIVQINQAILQLTSVMEQTMAQMRASEQAISVVRDVAQRVSGFVAQYDWDSGATGRPAAGLTG